MRQSLARMLRVGHLLALVAGPTALWAQEAPQTDSGDTAWLLTSSAFVLLMTPGLALFYGGMVRRKNVLGTIMHSFILIAWVSVIWALYGYSLAFHEGSFWGGFDWAFLRGVGADPDPYGYGATIPHQVFMAFQLMFAIITPALISGAFAERIKFSAMLMFMWLWSSLVYSPLAHWVWGKGGYLRFGDPGAIFGALDFAGGTVVHISSGVSALIMALLLGKRVGYGRQPIIPHNMTMTVTGASLLWFGWFGFNAGSAVSSGGLAGSAFIATHFAAAAATLSWIFVEWLTKGKPSALGAASGAVVGLVAITPASGYVTPMSGIIIGLVAGAICFWACTSLKAKFGYDDSLDVFGVHGVGGTTGAILTGVFASKAVNPAAADGLLNGNSGQLVNQLAAVAITWIFAIVMTLIIAKVTDSVIGLRVSREEEMTGLDLSQHGESGYNLEVEEGL
ncbi:MAG: ammonia channel protein [Acidobacteria bacterium RIFCSPLOWO2_02_FULL_61_28]|nr:MAG: ammonia channel protein [Acidobacteria bacterium RIFCSPLOWO2_02_FULL_61_28]